MPGEKFWETLPLLKGQQLWVALAVVILVALFFLAKHILAPGTEVLAVNREERRGEAEAWRWQAEQLSTQLKTRDGELTIERSRVLRFSSAYEHACGLLHRVLDSCSTAPPELRKEANALPPAEAILQEE